jgi:hypothetical protein
MAKNEKPKDPTSPIQAGGGRETPDKGGQRPGQGNPGQNNPGQNPGQGGQRPDQNKPGQGGQR